MDHSEISSHFTKLAEPIGNALVLDGLNEHINPVDMHSPLITPPREQYASATFGAGCFWGVQKFFAGLPGVIDSTVGYMGGELTEPDYHQVCRGPIGASDPGHVEVVRVSFAPDQRDYAQLLQDFLACHNPAHYYKRQYQSVIFYHDQHQHALGRALLQQHSGQLQPLVTVLEPAARFWRAEDHHQHYYRRS